MISMNKTSKMHQMAYQNELGRFSMKRFVLAAILPAVCAAVFAYNPPYGGEEIYRLTNPEMMMGAASASGGLRLRCCPRRLPTTPQSLRGSNT